MIIYIFFSVFLLLLCCDGQLIYSPFEESTVDLDDICTSGFIHNEIAIIAESGAGMKVFDI